MSSNKQKYKVKSIAEVHEIVTAKEIALQLVKSIADKIEKSDENDTIELMCNISKITLIN